MRTDVGVLGIGRLRAWIVAVTVFALVCAAVFVGAPSARADTAVPQGTPNAPETVSSDPLPTVQVDGVVWSTAIAGGKVYAGGQFTTARPAGAAPGTSTTPRANLLRFDLATGQLDAAFDIPVNGTVNGVAASPDGSRVYVVGSFTKVGSFDRYRIAAIDTATSTVVPNFSPGVNSTVVGVAATNSRVYFTGWFSAVNNVARGAMAAVDANGALVAGFAPQLAGGNGGRAVVISPGQDKVVVAGSFLSANGSTTPGRGMAALDANTGATLPWAGNSVIRNAGSKAAIMALASDSDSVYGTGYDFGGTSQDGLEGSFRMNWSDGAIKWMEDCHGDTYGIAPMDGVVYKASHTHYCGNIGEFPQTNPWYYNHGLAFSKDPSDRKITADPLGYRSFTGQTAGRLLHWYPELTPGTFTGQSQAAWNVSAADGYVVYAGEFPTVQGVRQQGLVRFATKDKAPDKQGPVIQGASYKITASSSRAGMAKIAWPANYDSDNAQLSYTVERRDRTAPLNTQQAVSTYWVRPSMSYLDTSVTAGSTYQYRVRVADPFGNSTVSDWTSVTVATASPLDALDLAVLGDAPSAYWPMDESSGSTAADMVGTDSLKLNWTTRGVAGPMNGTPSKATRFGGSSLSNAAVLTKRAAPATFSVEAWFRTTSTRGGAIVGFGTSASSTSSTTDRMLYLNNAGAVTFGVNPGTRKTITSAAGLNDGRWHQVVGTLSAAGQALYVDGRLVRLDANSTSAATIAAGYWRVGGDSTSGWPSAGSSAYLAGDIAAVAVSDTAVTGTQVDAHWVASGRPSNAPQPPVASFTAGGADLTASVDASASSDPDGTISSYTWDFGDGSTGSGATATHAYAAAGTYTITLTVTDDANLTATTTKTFTAVRPNAAPTAAFTAATTTSTVAVDASASTDSDGTIASYAWDFGDGSTGTGASATHQYATAGTFTITLTVTDDKGATGTTTRVVNPTLPPNAAPTAAFTSSTDALVASFDASASTDPDGTVVDYAWDFGDGTTGTGVKPSHTYTAAGTYIVTLIVTDNRAGTGSKTANVSVAPASTVAADAFARTVATGWGNADFGGGWTLVGGAPAFAVAQGVGTVTLSPAFTRDARLDAVSATQTLSTVTVRSSAAAQGGAVSATLNGRIVGSSAYSARVRFEAGGVLRLYLLQGEAALGGTSYVLPDGAQPNVDYTVQLSVTGTSPTTLGAKVWKSGTPAPAGWQISATDSTAALQAPGSVGIKSSASSLSTVPTTVLSYSGFTVTAPQALVVNVAPPLRQALAGVLADGTETATPGRALPATPTATPPADAPTPTPPADKPTPTPVAPTDTPTPDAPTETPTADLVPTAPAGAFGWDVFQRADESGWGTASLGGEWTSSTPDALTLADGAARLQLAPGSATEARLSDAKAADVSVETSVRALATGVDSAVSVVARAGDAKPSEATAPGAKAHTTADADAYRAELQFAADGTVALAVFAGDQVLAAPVPLDGLDSGAAVRIRLQTTGSAPTTVRAKAWTDGSAEPADWTVSVEDSTPALQDAGLVGLRGTLAKSTSPADTRRFEFAEFVATTV